MIKHSEKGFAMVLAIVLLLAMSLMGGSLILISSEDHTSNTETDHRQQTFYIAELALLEGEKYLLDQMNGPWSSSTMERDFSKKNLPQPHTKKWDGITLAMNYKKNSKHTYVAYKKKLEVGTFKITTKNVDRYTVETKDACFKSFPEIDHKNFITIGTHAPKVSGNQPVARSYNFGIFLQKALVKSSKPSKIEKYEFTQLKDFYYEYFIERIGDASIKAFGASIKATASDVSKNGVAYRVYGCGMHAPSTKANSSSIKGIVALESVVVLPK
tara:strand:- start:4291 stop:5103 length:813 start_codon:yes stop_codon:yes gene_type:complete